MIQMTIGGRQAEPHFLTGYNKFITFSFMMVRKKCTTQICWLRSKINYGGSLRVDSQYSVVRYLNYTIVRDCMSHTY